MAVCRCSIRVLPTPLFLQDYQQLPVPPCSDQQYQPQKQGLVGESPQVALRQQLSSMVSKAQGPTPQQESQHQLLPAWSHTDATSATMVSC